MKHPLSSNTQLPVAAAQVLSTEPALLQTILDFVLVHDDNNSPSTKTRSAIALHTIALLCRTLSGLSTFVGPSKTRFWRTMMLRRFDLSVDPSDTPFNVEDSGDYLNVHQDAMRNFHKSVWRKHPVKPYYDAWQMANPNAPDPDKYLHQDLVCWSEIDAYFGPIKYGFLTEIQQVEPS